MKLRDGDPWMPAPAYSKTLVGLTVNLLVREIAPALAFQEGVLGAEVLYSDPDFAALQGFGGAWNLHADHTYDDHPARTALGAKKARGLGAEIRLHGCDPDAAEAAARRLGYRVLAETADKGHGLREVYILDPDGYLWVPDVPVAPEA